MNATEVYWLSASQWLIIDFDSTGALAVALS